MPGFKAFLRKLFFGQTDDNRPTSSQQQENRGAPAPSETPHPATPPESPSAAGEIPGAAGRMIVTLREILPKEREPQPPKFNRYEIPCPVARPQLRPALSKDPEDLPAWLAANREIVDVEAVRRDVARVHDEPGAPLPTARFPLDAPAPSIVFRDHGFVLSGVFHGASRQECAWAITCRRGIVQQDVSWNTDYLVLGSEADSRWKYGIFGAKVACALDLKAQGQPLAILSEEHLLTAIQATPTGEIVPAVVGKYFFLTGRFKGGIDRLKERIEAAGGRVVSRLTKGGLDYVVAGSRPSQKIEQARAWGKAILSEEELEQLLDSE